MSPKASGKRKRAGTKVFPSSSTGPIPPQQGTSISTSGGDSGKQGASKRPTTRKGWSEKSQNSDPLTPSPPIASEKLRKLLNALSSAAFAKEKETVNDAYDTFVLESTNLANKDHDILEEIRRLETQNREDEIGAERLKRPSLVRRYHKVLETYRKAWQEIENELSRKYEIDFAKREFSDDDIKKYVKLIEEPNAEGNN